MAEWILDNERGWVVAHQPRARIPDKDFGDHLAWFNWAFGLYQRWAPRRFTFWRRFLDLPDFDETLEPAVQVFDTDIDTVLATVPNFDTTSERYTELLHRAKRARRLGKLDWAGERRKPQQRRAFDLVAALYSNVPLRKFKGATWWQDAGTLDRWMFKHKPDFTIQRDAPAGHKPSCRAGHGTLSVGSQPQSHCGRVQDLGAADRGRHRRGSQSAHYEPGGSTPEAIWEFSID